MTTGLLQQPPAGAHHEIRPRGARVHTSPQAGLKAGGIRSLVAFDHCRVLLPHFTFLRRLDPVARLHRLAFTDLGAATRAQPAELFWARLLFGFVVLRQLQIYFARYGAYVKRHHGISRWHQIRDLWYCAWRHNQSPRHYYWRNLFRLRDREKWLDYLEHRQVNSLLDHLNRRLNITRATNKFVFYHHCLTHCLPTPEVHAAWTDQGHLITTAPLPLAYDLFAKPVSEYGSVGTAVIPYDPVTRTHRFAQSDLVWPDLLSALAQHAKTVGYTMILQRRMRNSPRLSNFGQRDICNLRIVTAHPVAGTPEAIAAFIRLPSSHTTTGHDRHVLIAGVEIESGRMSSGRFREITKGEFPFHPDTGAPIAGQCLPGWSDMLELALRAHGTFPWLPFIGWDIVDTDHGLLLLEANAYWGADALQLPGSLPLGRTRFPRIYLEWFDHLLGSETPGAPIPL